MNQEMRLNFQKGDWMAIVLVIVLAAAVALGFLPGGEAAGQGMLEVYHNGELASTVSLDADAEFQLSGVYTNTIAVQDGRAAIIRSDCPGGDCVHSGWIDTPGRSVVCLPNRVELRIAGSGEVDFVVR